MNTSGGRFVRAASRPRRLLEALGGSWGLLRAVGAPACALWGRRRSGCVGHRALQAPPLFWCDWRGLPNGATDAKLKPDLHTSRLWFGILGGLYLLLEWFEFVVDAGFRSMVENRRWNFADTNSFNFSYYLKMLCKIFRLGRFVYNFSIGRNSSWNTEEFFLFV